MLHPYTGASEDQPNIVVSLNFIIIEPWNFTIAKPNSSWQAGSLDFDLLRKWKCNFLILKIILDCNELIIMEKNWQLPHMHEEIGLNSTGLET